MGGGYILDTGMSSVVVKTTVGPTVDQSRIASERPADEAGKSVSTSRYAYDCIV